MKRRRFLSAATVSAATISTATASMSDRAAYGKFFHAMLGEGVYLAPSQFEAGFISIRHTDDIIDRTIEAARHAFASIKD